MHTLAPLRRQRRELLCHAPLRDDEPPGYH